jgi:hypothetical protein
LMMGWMLIDGAAPAGALKAIEPKPMAPNMKPAPATTRRSARCMS